MTFSQLLRSMLTFEGSIQKIDFYEIINVNIYNILLLSIFRKCFSNVLII